ncbi:hypothetical protein [Thermoanaerobacter thermocopriae]|uniref:hypothetical protein n=1 Tax=Thermoanaerobacter thermocopriae TaxID=29350 RepID=UPI0004BA854F|nr:hypothetical protein [Thermoanaerobacter thermocopriae]
MRGLHNIFILEYWKVTPPYKVYESQNKKIEALKNINLTINKMEIFRIIGLSSYRQILSF